MTNDKSWQWKYFGLPIPLDPSAESHAMAELRAANLREEVNEEERRREHVAAVRRRREQQEADRLAALVDEFGSIAVETLTRRADPRFTLPPELQGIPPKGEREDR